MTARMSPDLTYRADVSATPIRLADGVAWGFSRPTVRLFPKVATSLDRLGRPVERVSVGIEFGYPLEIERIIDGVQSACEHGTVQDQYEAFFALAASLLRRCHEISLATACDLLSVPESELHRLVREVMAVVSEAQDRSGGKHCRGTDL